MMSLVPGTQVGSYEVLDLLGSGGMASVYRAQHRVLGSQHALKVLRSDLVANIGIRQRFLDEGRVQAQLQHPGIVRVTDLVSEPGVAGLVMDLLVGAPLDLRLEEGALTVERAVGWMLQVLGAVGYAHEHGVVHRDLKPSNLFITEQDPGGPTIRVLDFGIAKLEGKARTLVNEMVGTYAYMSPEQVQDASKVDARSDVFALGAVLFEMVTGQPAFEGDSDYITMQRVARAEHAPLNTHAHIPDSLGGAIERALQLDRDARFESCEAFAQAIRKLARPEDLSLMEDWSGAEAPAPLVLGSNSMATWNEGVPIKPVDPEDLPTISDGPERGLDTLPDPHPNEGLATLGDPMITVESQEDEPGESTLTAGGLTATGDLLDPPVVAVVEVPESMLLPVPEAVSGSTALDRERHEVAVRLAGAAQILAGLLNTFALWMVMCWGMPWVFSGVFTALGLPGMFVWLSWFASLLGCGLLVLGPIEILSGLLGVMGGASARPIVQRTAILQLVAIGMGGIPSFLVGLCITGLLLSVPEPTEAD